MVDFEEECKNYVDFPLPRMPTVEIKFTDKTYYIAYESLVLAQEGIAQFQTNYVYLRGNTMTIIYNGEKIKINMNYNRNQTTLFDLWKYILEISQKEEESFLEKKEDPRCFGKKVRTRLYNEKDFKKHPGNCIRIEWPGCDTRYIFITHSASNVYKQLLQIRINGFPIPQYVPVEEKK